jgi:putative membrane protein
MRSKSLLVGLVSGALAACGGRATPPPQPSAKTVVAEPQPNPHDVLSTSSRTETTAAMVSGRAGALSDEQVAGVRNALHDGQMEQGRLAEQKAVNERVKDFAATLASRHAVAKERQAELLDRLAMKPVESQESNAVRDDNRERLEALESTKGVAFDEAFLDAEAEEQNLMLDTIGNHLIPNTQNPDLKADLVRLVPQCVVNLREMMEIRRDIAATPVARENETSSQRVGR